MPAPEGAVLDLDQVVMRATAGGDPSNDGDRPKDGGRSARMAAEVL